MNNKGSVDMKIILVLFIIGLLSVFSVYYISNYREDDRTINREVILEDNEEIIMHTEQFIEYLFDGNKDGAGDMSLGVVRYNILSNTIETESSFSIKSIKTKGVFSSEKLAIAKSAIEYTEDDNESDVVFYEVRLLKEDDDWKVFYLNEEEPAFNYSENSKPLINSEEFEKVFKGYVDTLSKGEYKEASQFLIGRARKMHKKANPALNELNLINKIKDLENSIIYGEENIAVAKFNYVNNDRPLSVLVYFYLTEQGWKIYNVSQI